MLLETLDHDDPMPAVNLFYRVAVPGNTRSAFVEPLRPATIAQVLPHTPVPITRRVLAS